MVSISLDAGNEEVCANLRLMIEVRRWRFRFCVRGHNPHTCRTTLRSIYSRAPLFSRTNWSEDGDMLVCVGGPPHACACSAVQVTMSGSRTEDVHLLAKAYFRDGQYRRAVHLLQHHNLLEQEHANLELVYLGSQCMVFAHASACMAHQCAAVRASF